MPDLSDRPAASRANPLVLPLVAVSIVAVAEAVVLAVLLTRPPATAREAQSPTVAAAPAPASAPAADRRKSESAGPARGKRGQRVESGGFGITVEEITDQPTLKDMARVGPDERYLALLIAADNQTGGNAAVYPSQFRLQDDKGFGYDPLNLKVKMPTLEWRTLGNRETVRGYVDFVIPKSAKNLLLVYTGVESQPIQVELGE